MVDPNPYNKGQLENYHDERHKTDNKKKIM